MYSVGEFHQIPVVMYEDHRFILPVILEAQKEGVIPTPSVLVGFDQHHDALPPRSGLGEIPRLHKDGYPPEEFQTMVCDHLSPQDDDWLRAGMELGLISDAVVFGVRDRHDVDRKFTDHTGQKHKIFLEHCLPGDSGRRYRPRTRSCETSGWLIRHDDSGSPYHPSANLT